MDRTEIKLMEGIRGELERIATVLEWMANRQSRQPVHGSPGPLPFPPKDSGVPRPALEIPDKDAPIRQFGD